MHDTVPGLADHHNLHYQLENLRRPGLYVA
jgi:hypothetical protein